MHGVMLEHIQPRQRAKQAVARLLAAAGFVVMHQPAQRPQWFALLIAGRFQQQLVVVAPLKPALRPMRQGLRRKEAV